MTHTPESRFLSAVGGPFGPSDPSAGTVSNRICGRYPDLRKGPALTAASRRGKGPNRGAAPSAPSDSQCPRHPSATTSATKRGRGMLAVVLE